jgi:hypothetical protein
LKSFLDQFPERSTFASICQQNLSGGLAQIGDLLRAVLGDPCIEGRLADVDSSTPGDQFDCSLSQKSPDVEDKILPTCPATITDGDKPCWHIDRDPGRCCDHDPAHPENDRCLRRQPFVLKIERTDTDLQNLPNDTNVIANCVTEVGN